MKTVTCRDINGNKQEVSVDELSVRLSVYGVAIKDSQVLLVPQWDGYDIPGGGLDLGESMEECLIRGLKEETGLDVVPGEIVYVQNDFFTHPRTGKHLQTPLLYYNCTVVGGEITADNFTEEEKTYAGKAEWVDIAKLPELKFYHPIDAIALIKKAQSIQGV